MGAVKAFLMECEIAVDFLRKKWPKAEFEIGTGIVFHVNGTEYEIIPVVREDYPTSRKLKGWKAVRFDVVSPVKIEKIVLVELASSYEGAAASVEEDQKNGPAE